MLDGGVEHSPPAPSVRALSDCSGRSQACDVKFAAGRGVERELGETRPRCGLPSPLLVVLQALASSLWGFGAPLAAPRDRRPTCGLPLRAMACSSGPCAGWSLGARARLFALAAVALMLPGGLSRRDSSAFFAAQRGEGAGERRLVAVGMGMGANNVDVMAGRARAHGGETTVQELTGPGPMVGVGEWVGLARLEAAAAAAVTAEEEFEAQTAVGCISHHEAAELLALRPRVKASRQGFTGLVVVRDVSLDLGKTETTVVVSEEGISLPLGPRLQDAALVATWEELEEIVQAAELGEVRGVGRSQAGMRCWC
jgi:hypothetical protein